MTKENPVSKSYPVKFDSIEQKQGLMSEAKKVSRLSFNQFVIEAVQEKIQKEQDR